MRLVRMDGLVDISKELKNEWPLFFHLYRRVKREGLNKQDITDLLENQQRLVELEKESCFIMTISKDCNYRNSNLKRK
ncbi:MAG: hypothetical protein M3Z01_04285 [Thermoproteota archaeon]|nr:hypothetical protein [Thermoproteota archaeon]